MTFFTLLVALGCVSAIRSETCLGQKELSLISSIESTLNTLKNRLKGISAGCPSGWKEFKNHCYYTSPDITTWYKAKKLCKQKGGYLAQITDSAEDAWVANLLRRAVQHHHGYWMGAEDFTNGKWRWVNDSSKVQYTHWKIDEPNNSGGVEHCAHFWRYANYRWNDTNCTHGGIGYLCEKTKA
ncbi:mannose receptor, C type [Mytilus galloprovincialis]|uniref:Mannose receptor, C type n=2 Tax=Mytilus galloprovincialis TaxID=29158 RepID=A0A8B6C4D4_MYTGA|nr:mannose receptor, C type [Mytilus galloprovincialis]